MAGERGAPRCAVASCGTYREARGAVDYLSEVGFPVECVSIAAQGLRLEERATGGLGYGRAALVGAGCRAVPGGATGLVFGLLSLVDPLDSGLVLALDGLVLEALLGADIGLASHAAYGGGRRGFFPGDVRAECYEIVADDEFAGIAERYLAGAR